MVAVAELERVRNRRHRSSPLWGSPLQRPSPQYADAAAAAATDDPVPEELEEPGMAAGPGPGAALSTSALSTSVYLDEGNT